MARERMYQIKKNTETGEYELVNVDYNFHESLLKDGRIAFEKVFSREYARTEYFRLKLKYDNGTATPEDVEKMNLVSMSFGFDSDTNACTDVSGTPKELIGLMFMTLFAHGVIIKDYTCKKNDGKEVYKLEAVTDISLGLSDFYNRCRTVIPRIKSGAMTLEDAVIELKPLYNDCTTLINHNAVDNVCKKWEESKKEKNTRAFITGLMGTYKLTRSNRIDEKSPLKTRADFEKYVAMWLVTGGTMIDKKKKDKNAVTLDSMIKNATAKIK